MRIVSVNISSGRTVFWKGRMIDTGIFKESVGGSVRVRSLHFEGDRQSDLKAHGGKYKAVYAYSTEHYVWWRRKFGYDLAPGAFGENLTIEGLPKEKQINVGDAFRMGTAVLQAAQPRLPCYKLGIRFGDEGMIKRFLDAERWGIYFRVLNTGAIEAGDRASRIFRDSEGIPISALANLILSVRKNPKKLECALQTKALPPDLRRKFEEIKKSF